MKLENIGFYTLNDKRAETASHKTNLSRCEIVLTARCNFKCPYCRSIGGEDIPYSEAEAVVVQWTKDGLKNIRFSGGEPTLYKDLNKLCQTAKAFGVERIAVSTNGSASKEIYQSLIDSGVDDFSVSLDACCAEDGDKMAGGIKGAFDVITSNIQWLSKQTYVTVGVVLTDDNIETVSEIIEFSSDLGVSDIRVIPAAQNGDSLNKIKINSKILQENPILSYRVKNIQASRSVRGLKPTDSKRCGLVLDDIAVNQGKHYPCIIYMRESGKAIGDVCQTMRDDRFEWYKNHNTHTDIICKNNCLDVCVDYNNRFDSHNEVAKEVL